MYFTEFDEFPAFFKKNIIYIFFGLAYIAAGLFFCPFLSLTALCPFVFLQHNHNVLKVRNLACYLPLHKTVQVPVRA